MGKFFVRKINDNEADSDGNVNLSNVFILKSLLGANNGVATLDSTGKLNTVQIPFGTTANTIAEGDKVIFKDTIGGASFPFVYRSNALNSVGIKIKLPFTHTTSKMVIFTVRVYGTYQSFDIQISGYLFLGTNNWSTPRAVGIGLSTNINVKFGRDTDGKAYIWIPGKDYVSVAIQNVVSAYQDGDWNDGWSVERTNTTPNLVGGSEGDQMLYPNLTLAGGTLVGNLTGTTFIGALTGNATSATKLAASKNFTIGNTAKAFDGSINVAWTLAEIGAAPDTHTHTQYLDKSYLNGKVLANANTITEGTQTNYLQGTNKPTGSQEGSLLSLSFDASWATQLYGDWRTNEWYVRTQNNGSWAGGWKKLWHEGNLVNVSQLTNNVGYVTSSALNGLATQAWVSQNFDQFSHLNLTGSIDAVTNSGLYRQEVVSDGYNYVTTLNLNSMDSRQQLMINRDGSGLKFRANSSGSATTGWSTWKEVWHTENFNPELYLKSEADTLQSVTSRGNSTNNIISVIADGVTSDPYGKISVTRGIESNFAYYGLTRAGSIGWSLGIDVLNNFIIGGGGNGGGIITSTVLQLSTVGTLSTSGFSKFGSNDDHLLLGGGGHVLKSTLATASENAIGIGLSSGNNPNADNGVYPYFYSPYGFIPLATRKWTDDTYSTRINNGQTAYDWGNHKSADTNQYLGATYIGGGYEKPIDFGSGKLKLQMLNGTNLDSGVAWNDVLWLSAYTGEDVKGSNALVFGKNFEKIGFIHQPYDSATWGTYREIYHTGNFNPALYMPTTHPANVITTQNIIDYGNALRHRGSFVNNVNAASKTIAAGVYGVETANGAGNINFPSNSAYGTFTRLGGGSFYTDLFNLNDGGMYTKTWYDGDNEIDIASRKWRQVIMSTHNAITDDFNLQFMGGGGFKNDVDMPVMYYRSTTISISDDGFIYTNGALDHTGNMHVSGTLNFNTIVKSGGTDTQVLMANGTVKEVSTFASAAPSNMVTTNTVQDIYAQKNFQTTISMSSADSIPGALGTVGTNYKMLLTNTNLYGMSFWTTGTGEGFIQQQRFDGNAVAYTLNLQPLGGDVKINNNIAWHGGNLDKANLMTLSGTQVVTGSKTFNTTTSFNGQGITFDTASVIINGGGTAAVAKLPTLGFHMPGMFAGTMRMLNGSTFGLYAQNGTEANINLNTLNASVIVKSGGTSTQVLMANGTVKEVSTFGSSPTAGTNISVSGSAVSVVTSPSFTGSVTAQSFLEGSLRILKENIEPLNKSGLELVNSLDIVTYDKIDGAKNKIGIIADDSAKEFLSETQTEVDLYKTIFIQAKAIQELTDKTNNLENQLQDLRELVLSLTQK